MMRTSAYGISTHPRVKILKANRMKERKNIQRNVRDSLVIDRAIVAILNSQMVMGDEKIFKRFLSHASCKNSMPISS
jgi:hypothetical protein